MSRTQRYVAVGLAILFMWLLVYVSQGQTVNQATLREQIQNLKAMQREEINRVEKDLKASKDYAITLWTELDKAQGQMAVIGTERDNWKLYGEDQHEKFINAEKRVAEKQAHVLKLYMTVSGLVLLIGAYLVAKFYFRLPI